jgi:hypothetical protein
VTGLLIIIAIGIIGFIVDLLSVDDRKIQGRN